MFTVILCGLIGAFWYSLDSRAYWHEPYNLFKPTFVLSGAGVIGLIGGAMIGVPIAGVLGAIFGPRSEVTMPAVPIVSLDRVDGAPGSFVLATYFSGCDVLLQFQVRNPDGSVTPQQIFANKDLRIVQDRNLQEIGYWTTTHGWIDYSRTYRYWIIGGSDGTTRQELRVPADTVIRHLQSTVNTSCGLDIIASPVT